MQTQSYNLKLPGKGKGNGTKGRVAFLAVKLFWPENVSIRKFEPIDDKANACADIGYEILFVDAMAVGKGVSIQKDIPQDNPAAYGWKGV